jgi:hypothetical protein
MSYTERFSEAHYPLSGEYPDSLGPATINSTPVWVGDYHRLVLVFSIGDMGQGATEVISLRQAVDGAAATNAAITGKTTGVLVAGTDDDTVGCIELRTEELNVDARYQWVYVRNIIVGAAVEMGWALFGLEPRNKPVPTTNWNVIVD